LVPDLQSLRFSLARQGLLKQAQIQISGEDNDLTRKVVSYLEHHEISVSVSFDQHGICCASKPIHELCPNCLDEYETYQESI
jgi:hypothetical protein